MVTLALPLLPLFVGYLLVAAGRSRLALGHAPAYVAAVVASLLTLGFTAAAVVHDDTLDVTWVPALDLRLSVGLDHVSVPLVVLTSVIGLLAVVIGKADPPEGDAATYYGCLLAVVGGALMAFVARDAVLFFVAFELVLVPMWVLIGLFGDRSDTDATRRSALTFVLYTVLGSMLMLAGILAVVAGAGTADLPTLAEGVRMSHWAQVAAAVLLAVGLAVKVPVWPLHGWLPGAHSRASTGGSMLLAAVLLKLGTYGMVRLLLPLREGFATIAPWLATVAVVGILWAGLVCLVEPRLKRIIAFSSVAHMGVVTLALCTGTAVGVQAALFGNLSHGIISALLFVVAGGLKHRWDGDDDVETERASVRDVSPRLGFALVLGLAASLGLPGLAGFWPEVMTLLGAWGAPDRRGWFQVLAVLAALGAVLGAAYALRIARDVWAGRADLREPETYRRGPWHDLEPVEYLVVAVLGVAIVVLGVWPAGLLDYLAPAVETLTSTSGGTR